MPDCLDTQQALAYLADLTPTDAAGRTEAHVEVCPACQDLLSRLADGGLGDRLSRVLAGEPTLPPPLGRLRDTPPPAARVGARARGPGRAPKVRGYKVLRELGRGGSGVVYLARDRRLGRPVALKMILAGDHATPEQLARFRAEAMLVSRLRHPNLVRVHHIGRRAGLPYCAMEYIEGGSLRRRLAGGPLPPREAAALAATLADALRAVHEAGVVHRDLKPENILLGADGTPHLADFGLARPLDGAEDERSVRTRASQVVGTPRYMAPEQVAGRPGRNGPGVDLHALGAILYEMLTGVPPFRAATLAQALAQVVAQEPSPPRRLAPGVPADLETVCLKCLEKEPSRRYPDAGALAEDLRRFLDGRPVLARPVGPGVRLWRACRRRPMVAGLAGALGLLFAGLAVGGPIVAARQAALAAELRRANDDLRVAKADAESKAVEADAHSELAQSAINDVLALIDRSLVQTQSIPVVRMQVLDQVVALQSRFAEGARAGPRERDRLTLARLQAAEAALDVGSTDRAVEALAPALAALRARADADPDDVGARAALARALDLLGRAHLARRDDAAAAAAMAEAIGHHRRLAARPDAGRAPGAALARALAGRARFEAERGRPAAAASLDEARDRCRAVARDDGLSFDLTEPIARALTDCSAASRLLGRHEDARDQARAAVWHASLLWTNNPFRPGYRTAIASAQIALALALEDSDPAEAERRLRGVRDVAAWMIADLPGFAEPTALRKAAHASLRRLLRDAGRADEADALDAERLTAERRRVAWPADWPRPDPGPAPRF